MADRRQAAHVVLALLASLACARPAAAQGFGHGRRDEFEERCAEQQRNNEAGFSTMPLLPGVRHISQVVDIGVREGNLTSARRWRPPGAAGTSG